MIAFDPSPFRGHGPCLTVKGSYGSSKPGVHRDVQANPCTNSWFPGPVERDGLKPSRLEELLGVEVKIEPRTNDLHLIRLTVEGGFDARAPAFLEFLRNISKFMVA